jgi:enamine deaminase RidA (YjgF/YER057c/UK114 family)
MNLKSINFENLPITANVSHFIGQSEVDEYHLIIQPTKYGSIETQLDWIYVAYQQALKSLGLDMQTSVFRRFFCSDLLNQVTRLNSLPFSQLTDRNEPCAISWVCQPSVPPAKLALWAYHIKNPKGKLDKVQDGSTLLLNRGKLSHYWSTGQTNPSGKTLYDQTHGIFDHYNAYLQSQKMKIADNLIRTWFFVQNIDAHYQELVTARREFFAEHGLTSDTHFIASTGIEGTYTDVNTKVVMDAYAISGVRSEQIEFLEALDHLSPTYIYGVTFERGTSVAYQDRKHIYISGTASIDNKGNILFPGDILRQLDRTLENVEALLKTAGATLNDMCLLIVYVRDFSDYGIVQQRLRERFGNKPMVISIAAVCRPGWLVEIEGQAIIPESHPELPDF